MRLLTVLLAIVVTSALSMASPEELEDDFLSPSKDLSPSELHESLGDDVRGERIFAFYTSTTTTRLTTSTLTALSTCLSIMGTTACRRRKRRASVIGEVGDNTQVDLDLDGTMVPVEALEELEPAVEREGRKLTIWTTGFTTLTLTTTSYLAGTTVTATAYCITPGLTAGCFGK